MQLRPSFITLAAIITLNGGSVLSLPLMHTEASSLQTHKPLLAHEPELETRIFQAEGRTEPTRGIEYDADFTSREPEVDDDLSVRELDELDHVDARDFDEMDHLESRDLDEQEEVNAREFDDVEELSARELEDLLDLYARELEDFDDLDGREFDDDDIPEARAIGTPAIAPLKGDVPADKSHSQRPKPASIVPNAKPNSNVAAKQATPPLADKNHAGAQATMPNTKFNSLSSSTDKNHPTIKATTPHTRPAAHKPPAAQQEKTNSAVAENHKHAEHEGQATIKGSASVAVKFNPASDKGEKATIPSAQAKPASVPVLKENGQVVKSGGAQSQRVEKPHATAHSSTSAEKNTSPASHTRGKMSKQGKGPKHINPAERHHPQRHSNHELQHHFGSGEHHEHRGHDHHRQHRDHDHDREHTQRHPPAQKHNHEHEHERSSNTKHKQHKSQERSRDHNGSKSSQAEPSPRAHTSGHDHAETHTGMHHGSRFGHEGHLRSRSRSVRFGGMMW